MGMLDDILSRRKDDERINKKGGCRGAVAGRKIPCAHYGPTPGFTEATWDLRVFGEVQQESAGTGKIPGAAHRKN